jgi:tRNA 5-methylaminomethyl-2-thiouridine biosynthesis bifunctional protein
MSFKVWEKLSSPVIDWSRESRPLDKDFDEGFHSDDPLAESRHVFIDAQSLPERFSRGPRNMCIGELGFGSGLNFRGTLDTFLDTAPRGARLHFVSVENRPWSLQDLKRFHEHVPLSPGSLNPWLERWPPLIPGRHQLTWADAGRHISLTLCFLDVAEALEELVEENTFRAQAWFLDGFSPGRNPAMWQPEVCRSIAKLSDDNATVSTYSAAGVVKRNLSDAGFRIERRAGFGRKRHMVVGTYQGPETPRRRPGRAGRVAIAGFGVAGVSLAHALVESGTEVDILAPRGDTHTASVNEAGLVFPRLARIWEPRSLWLMHGFAFANRLYRFQLREGVSETPLTWQPTRRPMRREHLNNLMDDPEWVRAHEAHDGHLSLTFPHGMTIQPRVWLEAARQRLRDSSLVRFQETWLDRNSLTRLANEYASVFVCTGAGALDLLPSLSSWLQPVHGQIDAFELMTLDASPAPITGDFGYLVPISTQAGGPTRWISGATFEPDNLLWRTTDQATQTNLERLESVLKPSRPPVWKMARAAVRVSTRNRLALAGKLSRPQSPAAGEVHILTGLGGHGFTLAPLAAQALAAQWLGSISPVSPHMMHFARLPDSLVATASLSP